MSVEALAVAVTLLLCVFVLGIAYYTETKRARKWEQRYYRAALDVVLLKAALYEGDEGLRALYAAQLLDADGGSLPVLLDKKAD